MMSVFSVLTRSAALCAALGLLLSGSAEASSRTVTFDAEDGHELTGTLWGNASAPGVLLLHQCNSSRAMYDELGGMLAEAGFKVLTLDFRGFGDSKGNGYDLSDAKREDWQKAMQGFPLDAKAGYAFLAAQGEGPVAGALGASCGGWQVVTLGGEHEALQRMGFFSSGLNAEHQKALLQMREKQFLMIAAEGDGSAATPAGTLAYRAASRTELLLYDGDAHGYPLFEQDPELASKIVAFFAPLLD